MVDYVTMRNVILIQVGKGIQPQVQTGNILQYNV